MWTHRRVEGVQRLRRGMKTDVTSPALAAALSTNS
jgi:hypothetical protein